MIFILLCWSLRLLCQGWEGVYLHPAAAAASFVLYSPTPLSTPLSHSLFAGHTILSVKSHYRGQMPLSSLRYTLWAQSYRPCSWVQMLCSHSYSPPTLKTFISSPHWDFFFVMSLCSDVQLSFQECPQHLTQTGVSHSTRYFPFPLWSHSVFPRLCCEIAAVVQHVLHQCQSFTVLMTEVMVMDADAPTTPS